MGRRGNRRAAQEGDDRQHRDAGRRAGKLIWDDVRLGEELAYVVPLGIPHSHFLGGPNTWTELDQDKALAWKRENAKRCRQCGTRKAEWQADRDAYVGDIEHCPGCERLEQEKENLADTEERSGQKGFSARLIPRELYEIQAAAEAAAEAHKEE